MIFATAAMREIDQLMSTLKRLFKQRGWTYRQVGEALRLSEPTVKRMFAGASLTLARLGQLAELLELSIADVMHEAEASRPRLAQLTHAQEAQLVADVKLLLVATCVLNHWSVADIVRTYTLTQAQCVACLLTLDKLRVLELLPGNRIRLQVARNFAWRDQGPIRQFFLAQSLGDFVDNPFEGAADTLTFAHGMLTAEAAAHLRKKLQRLQREFAELHEQSLHAPFEQRHGSGLLIALREWEPQGFEALRR
jgi:transcriptional regulator with XRE-family HTH domain